MVVKPLSPIIPRGRDLRGAAILSSGEICMVLEPQGLMEALPDTRTVVQTVTEARAQRKLILLAEDSVTTRAQEIRILEGAGYEVVAATDGLDAMGKLATRRFDAVVTDINMPRMDGLQLAAEIRGLKQYADLPIILVTSLASDEDKRRGLEVGANAYITKPEFDQTLLLDCLERVVG
jgi:two-component system chemotaxis sensor kinase CheA